MKWFLCQPGSVGYISYDRHEVERIDGHQQTTLNIWCSERKIASDLSFDSVLDLMVVAVTITQISVQLLSSSSLIHQSVILLA